MHQKRWINGVLLCQIWPERPWWAAAEELKTERCLDETSNWEEVTDSAERLSFSSVSNTVHRGSARAGEHPVAEIEITLQPNLKRQQMRLWPSGSFRFQQYRSIQESDWGCSCAAFHGIWRLQHCGRFSCKSDCFQQATVWRVCFVAQSWSRGVDSDLLAGCRVNHEHVPSVLRGLNLIRAAMWQTLGGLTLCF